MTDTKTKNDEILEELRRITKILAKTATRDQTQKEQIKTLSDVGFQPKEIAELLGTTGNTVNVALSAMRKSKKSSEKVKKSN